jgi:hypothetical protein
MLHKSNKTAAPTILACALWRRNRPNDSFPVSFEHLCKIFHATTDNYDVSVRRELGSLFNAVLGKKADNRLEFAIALLSDNMSPRSATMRNNITRLWTSMSTNYAFVTPEELCVFMSGLRGINNSGPAECSEDAPNMKLMTNARKACAKMGPEWLTSLLQSKPHATTDIKRILHSSKDFAASFLTE